MTSASGSFADWWLSGSAPPKPVSPLTAQLQPLTSLGERPLSKPSCFDTLNRGKFLAHSYSHLGGHQCRGIKAKLIDQQ